MDQIFYDVPSLIEDVKTEVLAMREHFMGDNGNYYYPCTEGQYKTLARFMNENLVRSRNRKPVLSMMVGHLLPSSKNISAHMMGVIIDWMVDVEQTPEGNRWRPSKWTKTWLPKLEILCESSGGVHPDFLK